MGIIKSVVEKLKLKELFAILFIAAIIITCLPKEQAEQIKIEEFRITYQTYISLGMIIIGAYYILEIIGWGRRFIRRKTHNIEKVAIQYMKTYMSPDEMGLLVQTFYDKINNRFRSSGQIDYSDGRKAALESKHIIYRASSVSSFYTEFAYNLQPYALKFLNRNMEQGNIKINGDYLEWQLK